VFTVLIQLIKNRFDVENIQFTIWDICFLICISIVSATNLNRIKLEIREIEDRETLTDWIRNYFHQNNGNKIHESQKYLVYEVEKPKRIFSLRKGVDYYLTTFKVDKVLIEGPFSKKPKCIYE